LKVSSSCFKKKNDWLENIPPMKVFQTLRRSCNKIWTRRNYSFDDIVLEPEDYLTHNKEKFEHNFIQKLDTKADEKQRPYRHKFMNFYLPMPYYIELPDQNVINQANQFIHHTNFSKFESYGNYEEIPEKKSSEIGNLFF
jgi:hypothetical protein